MAYEDAIRIDVQAEDDTAPEVPVNNTMPYGAVQAPIAPSDGKAELRAQAELAVRSQHGEFIHRNPNYERMVDEAEKQIAGSVEQNKDM